MTCQLSRTSPSETYSTFLSLSSLAVTLNPYLHYTPSVMDNFNANTGSVSPNSCPSKMRRTDNFSYRGASEAHQGRNYVSPGVDREIASTESQAQAREKTAVRKRNITSCQICRSRKTKCDNCRPSCGYCLKVGALCMYEAAPSSCHIIGPQILEAIRDLTNLVQYQQTQQNCQRVINSDEVHTISPTDHQTIESTLSPPVRIELHNLQEDEHNKHDALPHKDESGACEQRDEERLRPIVPQGVESVLTWKIFSPQAVSLNLIVDSETNIVHNHSLPSTEFAELVRLESKYIVGVHIKNPILDLLRLRQIISHVAENGLDWSTRTCLVAAVCAIGAITQQYKCGMPLIPDANTTRLRAQDGRRSDSEPELAMQYWSVAAKRLGFAIEQNDLEAVQCLCLAGIWYMHNMQPLQAWKYFSLAGNAWYSSTLRKPPSTALDESDSRTNSLTIEQSLYFTIYKSECELRVELDVTGSILENVDLSRAFPLPPTLDNQLSDTEYNFTERGWYYYLAEIAARHLINRLLRTHAWTHDEPSIEQIWRMVAQAEMFEIQLHEWYSSLPSMVAFDIPSGPAIGPHPDDLIQILRHRYLTIRELIYRPFVRLCVENRLDYNLYLRAKIACFASNGLQCSIYKLAQVSAHRHQCTWFMLRNIATSAMVLIAANKAHNNRSLLGARDIVLPEGWKERIISTMDGVGSYWDDNRGRASEIKQLIEWALANDA